MKITFIGAGNMGGSMAHGLYQTDIFQPEDITCTARSQETLNKCLKQMPGIHVTTDNIEAVKGADIVVFAVKPWLIEGVINQVKDVMDYNKQIVISVVAGATTEKLQAMLSRPGQPNPAIFYFIPNTAIDVKASMSFFVPANATQEQIDLVQHMMEQVGGCMQIEEKNMPACMALASCGIAYAYRYIRAAMEGGVEMGLYAKDAKKIVSYTVMGAAQMLLQNGTHPEEEIDRVTTPGGLTIKGLNTMEENGFTNAVIKGLKAGR